MTQTLNIKTDRPLTEFERRQVETYAEFLIARRQPAVAQDTPSAGAASDIRFDSWAGCLADIEPEKSNKQFVQNAWDELLDTAEK